MYQDIASILPKIWGWLYWVPTNWRKVSVLIWWRKIRATPPIEIVPLRNQKMKIGCPKEWSLILVWRFMFLNLIDWETWRFETLGDAGEFNKKKILQFISFEFLSYLEHVRIICSGCSFSVSILGFWALCCTGRHLSLCINQETNHNIYCFLLCIQYSVIFNFFPFCCHLICWN